MKTKKLISLILLTLTVLASCTNLDEINRRLNEHEKRIEHIEAMTMDANNTIKNLQKIIDAQNKRITIESYKALDDGSGYILTMSDGSKITLSNGSDGASPLIGVKEFEGDLFWTLNGEFIIGSDGQKIKAEGEKGTDGISPKLRVNVDGYWEVSTDGGKTWSAILDTEGNPVQAKGKDSSIDLTITENDDAIIIKYNGQTFTIPKSNNSKDSLIYKVLVPNLDDFKKTNVIDIIDPQNKIIGQFCLEYIKDKNTAMQMRTIYTTTKNIVNHGKAYSLEDGGIITWDLANNECMYTPGSYNNVNEVFINSDGEISMSTAVGTIIEATIRERFLVDIRGSEQNSYGLTKIGTQYWMSENLRTLYYSDGSPITTDLSKKEWLETTEGAVTAYGSDNNNIYSMGALYNWYAINDKRGIAPEGYRVTTDEDWAKMAEYLDPDNYNIDATGARESETIAPLLKSTTGWQNEGNGNNLSGLNLAPNGSTSESKYMDFSGKGRQAYFWTSNTYENKSAMFRRLYYDEDFVNRWFENKTYGYSVRCILNN